MNQMGYSAADYVGRPVIAIINTWSDLNQCHAHFKQRVEDVKRGVLQAGGFPVELPAISLVGKQGEADHHALSQFSGDGDRGAAALAPCRWRDPDGRLRQDHAGVSCSARQALACPRSSCRPGRCCAATGTARCWAQARTPSNTGMSAAPEPYQTRTGPRWRSALRAPTASA